MSSYMDYYSLSSQPFGSTPNTVFYCDVPSQIGLLENILSGLAEGESFIKVTGEAGVGKTLLYRRVAASLQSPFFVCALTNAAYDSQGLRLALADELGVSTYNLGPSQVLRKMHDCLHRFYNEGKKTVLLIDEAQLLTDDALETIRMLTNLENNDAKLIQVVIFAQPSLDERLQRQQFSQILQRVNKSLYLTPLKQEDMDLYLSHRLVIAGHPSGQLFTMGAKKKLYKLSQGIPRLVNVLCNKSLLISYQRGLPYVDVKEINYSTIDCYEMLGCINRSGGQSVEKIIISCFIVCFLVLLSMVVYKLSILYHH